MNLSSAGKKVVLLNRLKSASKSPSPTRRSARRTPQKKNEGQMEESFASPKAAARGRSVGKSRTPAKSPARSPAASKKGRSRSQNPRINTKAEPVGEAEDAHLTFRFFVETPTEGGVLTAFGESNIASHKYVAGGNTSFDDFMNPYWNAWVMYLPNWMAPNLVTTLGGLFCLLSYVAVYLVNPLYDQETPAAIMVMNGICVFMYYTLDCMDGKQARRTKSSSPLGQLFDHGCDCLCNMSHFSTIAAILCPGPTRYALLGQFMLQFAFFIAQWQEYHTRELPHKFGEFGVTEVNTFTAVFSATFGLLKYLGVVEVSALGDAARSGRWLAGWPAMFFYLFIFYFLFFFTPPVVRRQKLTTDPPPPPIPSHLSFSTQAPPLWA